MGREVDAHRGEIAHDVAGVFVEGDEEGALVAAAGRFDEGARERGFAAAGAAGDQGIGAAVNAAAEHLVQALDAGGDALVERLRLRVDAIRGADFHARRPDDKRHFIEHVRRAAVLEHAHGPHRHAIRDALAEQHRAIGHERHEAVALRRGRLVLLDLRREDAGQLVAHEPFVKPVKLAAFRRRIVEQTQQHVDRVENDQLRAHLARFRLQRREQPGEVERAGLDHIGTQAGIDEKDLLLLELAHVPAKGLPIGRHPARVLLEGDKDARRAVVRRAR